MKKILMIAIFIMVGIGTVNAGLSDNFFCHVGSDEVVISLKKTSGFYKCSDIIASMESLILQTARDVMTIQTYINRGRDIEYRYIVKKEKLALLQKYTTTREQIIANIKTFETNLVKKSIYYFVIAITPYKVNLQRSLIKIDAMTGAELTTSVISYAAFLREQIATIEALSKAETIEAIIPLLNKYIYLKREISGRSE